MEPHRFVHPKNRHDPATWVDVTPEQVWATLRHVTAGHWLKLPNGGAMLLQEPELGEGYLGWFGHLLVSRELAAAFTATHGLPPPVWWAEGADSVASQPPAEPERPPRRPTRCFDVEDKPFVDEAIRLIEESDGAFAPQTAAAQAIKNLNSQGKKARGDGESDSTVKRIGSKCRKRRSGITG